MKGYDSSFINSQKINFSNTMSAILPLLLCRKTEPKHLPSFLLKNKIERTTDSFHPSIISKKLIGRRPTVEKKYKPSNIENTQPID
jgi:hypothetical protein